MPYTPPENVVVVDTPPGIGDGIAFIDMNGTRYIPEKNYRPEYRTMQPMYRGYTDFKVLAEDNSHVCA